VAYYFYVGVLDVQTGSWQRRTRVRPPLLDWC